MTGYDWAKEAKRFSVFAGNYGSGKTEISLNAALALAQAGKHVTLVDMDVVNPYFRSAEHADLLQEHGVRLIAPPFANTNVDAPSISAEVFSAFDSECAIFDAGGDPVGAAALGSLFGYFNAQREDTFFYYVMNARRPLQQTASEAEEMLKEISRRVRMSVDGLVNNTNLGIQTTAQDLLEGQEICAQVSADLGIPLMLTTGRADILEQVQTISTPTMPIVVYTRPDWMVEEDAWAADLASAQDKAGHA